MSMVMADDAAGDTGVQRGQSIEAVTVSSAGRAESLGTPPSKCVDAGHTPLCSPDSIVIATVKVTIFKRNTSGPEKTAPPAVSPTKQLQRPEEGAPPKPDDRVRLVAGICRSSSLPPQKPQSDQAPQDKCRRRDRTAAIALDDSHHLELVGTVTDAMVQTFDKHERFEALRFLSRRRRGVPMRINSEKMAKRKSSLAALMHEGKHGAGAAESDDDDDDESDDADVFIMPASPRHLSALDVAGKVQRGFRASMV